MSEPEEGGRKKVEAKASVGRDTDDPNRKPSSSGFRKSPSSLSSTASSTNSDKPSDPSSDPSSADADGMEDGSQRKNQLNLLASVSIATKSEGTPPGSSDSGVSDEPDTQDQPHRPQHIEEEATQPSQRTAQQIPSAGTAPSLLEAQLVQQNVIQALQSIINQPSSVSQPPNMMMIQQLAQHLVNVGNNAIPPQALGVYGSASNAAQLLLSQLTTNAIYQNPAPAINFIQKLQELIIQQQLAGNLSNQPTFIPLASVAAFLQQQNQLQQQQQLSSFLAIQQLTNPGAISAPAFSIPQLAAARNMANPAAAAAAAAMMNPPNVAAAPPSQPHMENQNTQLPQIVIEPTGRPALPLATDSDEANLAPYQCLLRQQIELFETREDDIYLKAQGRNTPIRVGQVGIRCRHCTAMAKSKRVEGSAVLYSKSLNGIYQVALNMGRLHFLNNSCPMIPQETKKELAKLKQLPRKVARGRQYWKETLESQGVFEEQEYLRFKSSSSSSS